MNNIIKFIFFDILKNKIVLLYAYLLFVISWSKVLGLTANYTKATLVCSILFISGSTRTLFFFFFFFYDRHSSQFIELLLSQPHCKRQIWIFNIFIGLFLRIRFYLFCLVVAFLFLLYSSLETGFRLLLLIVFVIFTVFAMLSWLEVETEPKE